MTSVKVLTAVACSPLSHTSFNPVSLGVFLEYRLVPWFRAPGLVLLPRCIAACALEHAGASLVCTHSSRGRRLPAARAGRRLRCLRPPGVCQPSHRHCSPHSAGPSDPGPPSGSPLEQSGYWTRAPAPSSSGVSSWSCGTRGCPGCPSGHDECGPSCAQGPLDQCSISRRDCVLNSCWTHVCGEGGPRLPTRRLPGDQHT